MKKKSAPIVPDLTIVAKATAAEAKESNELAAGVSSLVIDDDDSYRAGAELVASIKAHYEKVEGLRRSWVDPLNGVVASINKFFKPITTALERSEEVLKGKLSLFIESQSKERDRFIAAASKFSEAGKMTSASEMLASAGDCIVPKVAGLAVRETWDGFVDDPSAIPREYLVPDLKALLAVTRVRKGDTNIPGWKVEHRHNLAVSASTDDE